MKPAVTFADPVQTVVDYLRSQITDLPTRAKLVGSADTNMLLVRPDGPAQNTYPVAADAAVRVIAWAPDEFRARALAARALTVLATFPGNTAARSFGGFTGPDTALDPATGRDLAYIIVTVRQRPLAV